MMGTVREDASRVLSESIGLRVGRDSPGRIISLKSVAAKANVSLPTMLHCVRDAALQGRILFRKGSDHCTVAIRSDAALKIFALIAREATASARADGRLPPIAHLARESGASVRAVWKIVRELRDAGILVARRKSGTFLADRGSTALKDRAESCGVKWQRVAGLLYRDILNGIYRSDSTIANDKAIGRRYGASRPTIRKALGHLVGRNVLAEENRGYRLVSPQGKPGRGAVILVARGTDLGELFIFSSRTVDMLRELEGQCSSAGVELIVAVVNKEGLLLRQPCHRYASLAEALKLQPVLGFLVWTVGLSVFNTPELIRRLSQHQVPVAVLDETGETVGSDMGGSMKRVRILRLGSSVLEGRAVARHLLGLGHRRIAYLSLYHSGAYSRNRLAGLCEEYRSAGLPGEIPAFTADFRKPDARTNDGIRRIAGRLLKNFEKEGWFGMIGGRPLPPVVRRITEEDVIIEMYLEHQFRALLYPLIDKLLALRDLSALVVSNDRTALRALHYLQSLHIRVPGNLSVISFDNSPDASTGNLSSYDFNLRGAVNRMLRYVLGSAGSLEDEGGDIIGRIVERESTAKVDAASARG